MPLWQCEFSLHGYEQGLVLEGPELCLILVAQLFERFPAHAPGTWARRLAHEVCLPLCAGSVPSGPDHFLRLEGI